MVPLTSLKVVTRGVGGEAWAREAGALVPPFGFPKKPNNWSDLAGDRGQWGHQRATEQLVRFGGGEMGGGAPESSVGATRGALVPPFGLPKKPEQAREAGKEGEMGGGTREQCGSNKGALVPPFWGSLKNLTIGLIWLVTRGGWGEGVRGVGQGGGQGGDGAGVSESSVGATRGALVPTFRVP